MKTSTARCRSCGADLPARVGTLVCEYCGKETRVRADTQAGPATRPQAPVSTKAFLLPFLALALVLVGSAIAVTLSGQSAAEEAAAANEQVLEAMAAMQDGRTSANTSFSLSSNICLLADLNGDGAQEVAALFTSDGDSKLLAILDGATGETRWRGESLGSGNHLHSLCLGGEWIGGINNEDFSLTLINARRPEMQVRHSLSDELQFYGVSDSCFAFRSTDHETVGFSGTDGAPTECELRPSSRPHITESTTCGIISTMREGATFGPEETRFRLRGRSPGTAFLEVRATRGREELWDETLRVVPAGGDRIGCFVGVLTPGTFVLLGSPRGEHNELLALGLSEESGIERYATNIGSRTGRVRGFYYNGRYVLVGVDRRIVALDPATGQLAW